jgi:hypothetical protein
MLLSPHAFLDSSQPIHHSIYLPISPVLGHDSSIGTLLVHTLSVQQALLLTEVLLRPIPAHHILPRLGVDEMAALYLPCLLLYHLPYLRDIP